MNSSEHNRPNPDELLASLKQADIAGKRGKLKIFFGMCAGVGKTYTMLQSARTEKVKGYDVIIGYVETHRRPETLALLEGMEILPRKQTEYRKTRLEEMDLDTIIKRKPHTVLVDELAHTNAPGSRHLKRYQDVIELLDHGIHVYTTLNVQHLESKTDIVAQITGVNVRETIPDEIFEKAEEVELVDITPDELLERLAEGKVYTEQQSKEAVRNFFRKGNITALREMSLRIVADRVDKQVKEYMQEKRIPGPWKSGLHLMVLINHSLASARAIRWAKNLAYTMGAKLIALYVETPKKTGEQESEQLSKNMNLARQFGAEVMITSGSDLVKAVLSVAHKENITHIIVGKPRQRNLFRLLIFGNFVQNLIKASGNIDVYVLGSDSPDRKRSLVNLKLPTISSPVYQYFLAVILIGITTMICYPLASETGYQVVSLILLFVVSLLSTFMGIGPILLASTLSAVVWNYFFIPPMFTFHIGKTQDILMFFMFFIVAFVNGTLTSQVRRQEKLTRDREERTNALFQLTRLLSEAHGLNEIIHIAVREIKKQFSLESSFMIQDVNNRLSDHNYLDKEQKLSNTEYSIADWVYKHSKKAGRFTDTLPSGDLTYYPIQGTRIKPGVVAVKHDKLFHGEKDLYWDTYLTQISNAIERELLDEQARKAQFLEESDKLYKTLFNSISHELRIPVATILGASDSLLSTHYNEKECKDLYLEILTASRRLNRLIDNLLNMSRLESGLISAKLDWCDINDLINKVSDNLKDELKSFTLHVVIPKDMPLVKIDFGLMEQVLHNLVYNSCQYAPGTSTIRVKAFYDAGNLVMQVMDRGPGFPREALPYVFDKFFRVKGSLPGGTGLGLSIVKGFVEAHKGIVKVENRQNGGARFTIIIPTEIHELDNLPTDNV